MSNSLLDPEHTHTDTEMKTQELPFNKLRKPERKLHAVQWELRVRIDWGLEIFRNSFPATVQTDQN